MTEQEKVALLEDIMYLDKGTLTLDTELKNCDEWDSVAILSFIALMDEKFGKTVAGAEIRRFITVRDAVSIMQ